ncbi:hypothetical protein CHUAL_013044 [Chamberlinius hualienensis]
MVILLRYFISSIFVLALTETEGCLHPGKKANVLVAMTKKDDDGVFPTGTEADYSCDNGYEILHFNGSKRLCQENGLWSGNEPYCGINVGVSGIVASMKIDNTLQSLPKLDITKRDVYDSCKPFLNTENVTLFIRLNKTSAIDIIQLTFKQDGFPENFIPTVSLSLKTYSDADKTRKKIKSQFLYQAKVTWRDDKLLYYQYSVHNFDKSEDVAVTIIISKLNLSVCNIAIYSNKDIPESWCGTDRHDTKHLVYNNKCYVVYGGTITYNYQQSKNRCSQLKLKQFRPSLLNLKNDINNVIYNFIYSAVRTDENFISRNYWIMTDQIFYCENINIGYTKSEIQNKVNCRLTTNRICEFVVERCPSPDQEPGSFVNITDIYAFYSCPHGYVLVGNNRRTCSRGWWSEAAPQCKCGPTVACSYGQSSTTSTAMEETINVPRTTNEISNVVTTEVPFTECTNQSNSSCETENEQIIRTTLYIIGTVVAVAVFQWMVTALIYIYIKYKI